MTMHVQEVSSLDLPELDHVFFAFAMYARKNEVLKDV